MSDSVVRACLSEGLLAYIIEHPEPNPNCTVLLHNGDKRGEFERWMADFLRSSVIPETIGGSNRLVKIADALSTLWKDGDDDS